MFTPYNMWVFCFLKSVLIIVAIASVSHVKVETVLHFDWLLQVVPCSGRHSGGENGNLQCDVSGHHYGSDSKNAESADRKGALSDRGNQSNSKWRL